MIITCSYVPRRTDILVRCPFVDRHGTLRRSGLETHRVAAVQHNTDDDVAVFPRPYPLVGDGRAVSALCRRRHVGLAAALGRGRLRHRRLLPDAGLHPYRVAVRTTLYDPFGSYSGPHGTNTSWRADAPDCHPWNGGHPKRHRPVDSLKKR